MSEQEIKANKSIKIVGIIALSYYLLAALFPKALWGGHHIAFLPAIAQIIIFFLAGYFILVYPNSKEKPLHETILKPLTKLNSWKIQLAVATVFGVLFYVLPIHLDNYGDAAFLFTENDVVVQDLTDIDTKAIISFDLTNPKLGTETTLSLVAWLSYNLEVSSKKIFKIWDSLWGIGFVFLWLKLVSKHIEKDNWKALLVLLGCTSSFLQLYFGHFEIYAPVFTGLLLYFYALLSFLETLEKKKLLILLLSLLFCLKFHVTSFLLVPSFMIALYLINQKRQSKLTTLSPKWVLKFIFLPTAVLGIILYFYLGSFANERNFDITNWQDKLFLPVSSSEPAPYDRYNLFSFYHIIDFGNMIIQWSSAAVFLFIALLVGFRKKMQLSTNPLLTVGVIFLIQFGFFFLFNPLLSMPNDWDIMSIPAVSLLVIILLLFKLLPTTQNSKQLTGTVLALSFFSISIFVVNNNKNALSEKLQTQGEWEYQTYWIGASTSILSGINLEDNLSIRNKRLSTTIDNLEQYAVLGNDIEYAELLFQQGKYFYNNQDYNKALILFNKADSYSNLLCKNHYHQLICNFMLGDFKHAHEHSKNVITCNQPTPIRSLEIALHTSLEAGDVRFADSICALYLNKWPKNNFIKEAQTQIRNGKNPKEMFASGYVNPKNQVNSPNNVSLKFIDSLEVLIHEIKDSATIGNDVDFAALLKQAGIFYFDKQDYDNSLVFYKDVLKYNENDCESTYHILISNFMLKQFSEAKKYCDPLIKCKYPTPQKAYKIAIHTCIEGDFFGNAEQYCKSYLELWPRDEFVTKIVNAITSETNPREIKGFFKHR